MNWLHKARTALLKVEPAITSGGAYGVEQQQNILLYALCCAILGLITKEDE